MKNPDIILPTANFFSACLLVNFVSAELSFVIHNRNSSFIIFVQCTVITKTQAFRGRWFFIR
jgi:hypothetical protein